MIQPVLTPRHAPAMNWRNWLLAPRKEMARPLANSNDGSIAAWCDGLREHGQLTLNATSGCPTRHGSKSGMPCVTDATTQDERRSAPLHSPSPATSACGSCVWPAARHIHPLTNMRRLYLRRTPLKRSPMPACLKLCATFSPIPPEDWKIPIATSSLVWHAEWETATSRGNSEFRRPPGTSARSAPLHASPPCFMRSATAFTVRARSISQSIRSNGGQTRD